MSHATGATPDLDRRTLVVVGNGMVGHKLLEVLAERGATAEWDVVTFCEESRLAYDRVGLSSFFSGATADDLSMVTPGFFDQAGLQVHVGDAVASIDTAAAEVVSVKGVRIAYDALVLATGSYPFVPPVDGRDAPGCFVYRTIDDLEAIASYAEHCRVGAVVGGGLLGLEAANALSSLGLETHVVEFFPRLMPVQVDEGGGAALRRRIEDLGVVIHTSTATAEVLSADDGRVSGMRFAPQAEGPSGPPSGGRAQPDDLATEMVVFSAGIRPRDELARAAGLEVGERGGVVVDEACRTSDPRIFAIGECALAVGKIWGLVAPGYQMARVVADRILGGSATFVGADMSTKLKLMGIDVASFGDAFATSPGAEAITYADPVTNVYKRLVVGPERPSERDVGRPAPPSATTPGTPPIRPVVGGILVGDASMYQTLVQMTRGEMPTPAHLEELIFPASSNGAGAAVGVASLVDSATVCSCNTVTKGDICAAIAGDGLTDVGAVKACTKAGTGCGGCVPLVTEILRDELRKAGVEVGNDLCEHFAYTRQELFDIVRFHRINTFSEVLAAHGTGRGCEICKPAIASMLASLGNGYILSQDQAALQDTNDHFLANLQRDGTYSVVPRVPGGEITPDQLIAIGNIAKEFNLYTKITGAQRIDLFGARVDQLPHIWRQLVDVGMESGHAYGKALRTVKSCVGKTWCRFGVQDSTTLAIDLELRYRGLRAPHKIKGAVSGCTRECAEAQSKDFGVIATEKGWNVYVCGNGGMKPQHGVLLAADVDTETVFAYLDRFLMFYVRTADRLERTAVWLNKLDGGIDYLRSVVLDDALGICAELEADMARHVETYECEWKATIDDPVRSARFRTFVNSDDDDPNVVFVPERGQPRPAYLHEKPDPALIPLSPLKEGSP
ncbi:MAG: nitrite reductase large subunit NirB [Acidimicrobiales bacterium]